MNEPEVDESNSPDSPQEMVRIFLLNIIGIIICLDVGENMECIYIFHNFRVVSPNYMTE